MPKTSRVGRAFHAALLLALVAVLAACGGGGSSAPVAAGPTSPASSPADPSSPASSPTSSHPSVAAHAGAGQVVKVTTYGVSYEVPKGWTSLDGTEALTPDNPILRSIAQRLNITPQQVLASFKKSIQAMAVTNRGARNGILDNINSVGAPTPSLNDDQIKLQLATLGATLGPIHHFTSPAGPGRRLAYRWSTNGLHFHGEILVVDVGDSIVSITITAHSAPTAKALADQVQASIDRLG